MHNRDGIALIFSGGFFLSASVSWDNDQNSNASYTLYVIVVPSSLSHLVQLAFTARMVCGLFLIPVIPPTSSFVPSTFIIHYNGERERDIPFVSILFFILDVCMCDSISRTVSVGVFKILPLCYICSVIFVSN